MVRTAKARTSFDWDKEIAKVEKKAYYKDEVLKLYAEKKLKDGVIFRLLGCIVQFSKDAKPREAWAAGTVVAGKFMFVKYNANDVRINRLKRNGISTLMEIVKKGMVNTRQKPWLPHRYQSVKNPAFTLYGADSADSNFEGHKFKDKPQIFDQGDVMNRL